MSSNDSHLDSHLTPEDARAALDRAAGIKVTSDRDIRVLTRVSVGLGITMGLVLILIKAASNDNAVLGTGMAVYLLAILALVFYNSRVKSAPRGYGLRYGLGVGGSSLIYSVGVYLVSALGVSWPATLGIAVLTAMPLVVAASSIAALVKK